MLKTVQFATIAALAVAERIHALCLAPIPRQTLLAPDIVEAVLDGRQPEGMTLPGMMAG